MFDELHPGQIGDGLHLFQRDRLCQRLYGLHIYGYELTGFIIGVGIGLAGNFNDTDNFFTFIYIIIVIDAILN